MKFKLTKDGNVTVDKLLTHGKNFFDMAGLKHGYLLPTGDFGGGSTITLVDGAYIYNADSTSRFIGFHNEKYIEVEANSKYTFSRDWAASLSRNVIFYYYDADKVYISSSSSSAGGVIQLTTPANCKYMRMTCNNIYGYPFTIGETMVEEGHYSTGIFNTPIATAYEAYVSYTGVSLEYQEKTPNIYDTVFNEILEQPTGLYSSSALKAMFETNNEAANYLAWNNLLPSDSTLRIDGEEFIVKSAVDKNYIFIYPPITLDTDDIYYVRAEVKRLDTEIIAFFVTQASTQIDTLQEHEAYNDNLDVFNVLGGKVTGVAGPNNYLRFSQQCDVGGTYGENEAAWKNFVVLNLTDNFMTSYTEEMIEEHYANYRKYKYPELQTGREIITDYTGRKIYIDYDNEIAHDLTTIYGAGNEPTLATHEALILQYTNTALKAREFSENLQQEYMQLSLDTPVYEGLSLRDIFENYTDGITLPNGVKTFEISGNNLVQRVKKHTLQASDITGLTTVSDYIEWVSINRNNLAGISSQIAGPVSNLRIYVKDYSPAPTNILDRIDGEYLFYDSLSVSLSILITFPKGTYANGTEARVDLAGTDIYYQLATPITLQTFTTTPTQTQLDEWLDIYLMLTSNNAKTGTALVQDQFYVDYDNAKAYDYNIIEPYITETPADIQAFMEDVLDKTITLTSIPVKAKIYKDRFVILGKFIIVGE